MKARVFDFSGEGGNLDFKVNFMNSEYNTLGPNITCPRALSAKELPICEQVRGGDRGQASVLRGTREKQGHRVWRGAAASRFQHLRLLCGRGSRQVLEEHREVKGCYPSGRKSDSTVPTGRISAQPKAATRGRAVENPLEGELEAG